MRRLEYTRRIPTARPRTRTAAEAVMALAQVARERHRLEQERRGLERRLQRIDSRLTQIAGTETKLVPAIQGVLQRKASIAPGEVLAAPPRVDRLGEVTLHY
jgi:hypothetical protein